MAGFPAPAIVQYNNIHDCTDGIVVHCSDSTPLGSSIAYNTCHDIPGWAVFVSDETSGGPRPDVSSNICYSCVAGVFFYNANVLQNFGIFGGGNLVWKCGTPYASTGQPCDATPGRVNRARSRTTETTGSCRRRCHRGREAWSGRRSSRPARARPPRSPLCAARSASCGAGGCGPR